MDWAMAAEDMEDDGVEQCKWCTMGPECDRECDYVLDTFKGPVSDSVGGLQHTYWRGKNAPRLGEPGSANTAVLVQHGYSRNGNQYICFMLNAVKAAGLDADSVMVIAPQFFFKGDKSFDESKHMWWRKDWRLGMNSTDELPASISSFEVLDTIGAILADKALYPNMQRIIFSGHSAGGQTMLRYSMFNRFDRPDLRDLGVSVKYAIANPGSVTYLNSERPVLPKRTCDNLCNNNTMTAHRKMVFAPLPAEANCSNYDTYGYGMGAGPFPPYVASLPYTEMIAQYKKRDVNLFSGESDVCNTKANKEASCHTSCSVHDVKLDTSCGALAQGNCRMFRLHAYLDHVRNFYNESHLFRIISLPGVGHNGCGVIQSPGFAYAILKGW